MNKYQEAFNDIVNNGISVDYFNEQTDKNDNENTILIIQELVDKETPKKVKMEKERLLNDFEIERHLCPSCDRQVKSILEPEYYIYYCKNCGQKLDWEV